MNRSRVLPIAWVAAVLFSMGLANEPLRGMFEGTVRFNWAGYLVFGLLLIASLLGVVFIIGARRRDAAFRGIASELTRIVAIGEAITMASAWVFYFGSTVRL